MASIATGSLQSVFSYRWTISEFLSLDTRTGQSNQSPIIFAGPHKFVIELYPRGSSENSSQFVSCYLKILSGKAVEVSFRLSIYSGNHVREVVNATRLLALPGVKKNSNPYWGQTRFLERNEAFDSAVRLNNGQLVIICDIFKMDDIVCSCSEVAEHFENLSIIEEQEQFCDVQVIVGAKKFNSHKIILSNASKVFRAMLAADMEERRSNKIFVDECEPSIFEQMMKYMYSGKVDIVDDKDLEKLWIASDRYELIRLRDYCEEKLANRVVPSNLLDYLAFADFYGASKLRKNALTVFARSKAAFVGTAEFTDYIKSASAQLVNDILIAISCE